MSLLSRLESLGKAIWDTGKDVVGVIGDVSTMVDAVQVVGDYIGKIGDLVDVDKLVEVGEKLAGWAERVGLNKVLRAADSPILDSGQVVIAGMRLTTGFGAPETGEGFGKGGAQFRDAASTLASAQPDDDWSGVGSSAYAGQNTKQKSRAMDLVGVDHEVHRVLATEAYQVNFHRDRLDGWSNWLADVGLVTFAMGLVPGYGRAAKEATELAAVMSAVGSSSLELHQLSSEVDANSAALAQHLRTYESVQKSTGAVGSGPRPPDPPEGTTQPPTQELPPEQGPPDAPPPANEPAPGPAPAVPSAPGNYSGGAGGGRTSGGGSPAATPSTPMAPPRVGPAAPTPSASQPARSAPPAPMGAASPAPMAAPAASTPSGIPTKLINQAVQAAVQTALEKALEKAHESDDQDGDDEDRDEEGVEDKDGDGKPDEPPTDEEGEDGGVPLAGTSETETDLASPERPIAATLDPEEKWNRADAGTSTIER